MQSRNLLFLKYGAENLTMPRHAQNLAKKKKDAVRNTFACVNKKNEYKRYANKTLDDLWAQGYVANKEWSECTQTYFNALQKYLYRYKAFLWLKTAE